MADVVDPRQVRAVALDGWGADAQARVASSRFLVVGLGGLGCPAAQLLAGAGAKAITLVDFDTVDLSNLHRQGLYTTADVGRPKVEAASQRLGAIHAGVSIGAITALVTADAADALVAGQDVVLDCTDSLDARYALSDACQRAALPLVHAGIAGWDGVVAVFPPGGPCYRCLHPNPPTEAPTCGDGVLGPIPAVLGSMQALEALRLVAGKPGLAGRMAMWDSESGTMTAFPLPRRPTCPACAQRP